MYGKWLYKEIGTEYGACMVEIYRKNYTGESIEIGALAADSLSIALENLGSITDPIGKSVCSFSIIDTNQVEYDDFFTPDATALKVVVSTRVGRGAYVTRWSGYITPDFFAENLSYRTPISISARDNIGYLNDVDFDLTATTITVRELIQSAFRKIAEDYPMSLSFVSQKQTAEGVLAIDAIVSTALFNEMTWAEVLETILHDLALQMRWVDNNTIAVLDLSQIPEYYATQGFNFIDASGYREIVPAWRQLTQEQDYGFRDNFFDGWLRTDNMTFVKEEVVTDDIGREHRIKLYAPNNWQVSGNTYTINLANYRSISRIDGFTLQTLAGTYREIPFKGFENRIFFTGTKKENTDYSSYMGYRMPIYSGQSPLEITFKALNTYLIPKDDTLHIYNPIDDIIFADSSIPRVQLGIKLNILLHSGVNTYILKEKWEQLTSAETDSITFVLDKIGGVEPYYLTTDYDKEQELSINIHSIPVDGELEIRIYGYFIESAEGVSSNYEERAIKYVTFINDVTYAYVNNDNTGQSALVGVNDTHNIKQAESYKIGQVVDNRGNINAFAGGLYYPANTPNPLYPMRGFQRNADATNYNLLELVGREIIHFNKRNYNRLSGTIKNLDKEPLMFNRLFVREGKKYAPYNYSLNVISNEMNITSMQEVEPYTTANFTEVNSEITTGGSTVSSGNNQILQYSAEVGNAKRLYELQTISEDERLDAYVLVDGAGYPEARKLKLTDIAGLDEKALEQYLVQYKYLQEADITPIIQDFEKLEEAVNPLFGYFDATGNANNALKLGGHSAEYFATADALNTHITAFNNYKIATNKRLDDLEALWYMDDDGNVHTTHNIVVDKGGAFGMGAESGDIPSASVSIKFEGSTIVYSPVDGIITLPAYPSGGGGGIDETQLWNILGQSGTQTIHSSHIPDLSGKYLPLSGGAVNGSIVTKATPGLKIEREGNDVPYIRFERLNGEDVYGELGVTAGGNLAYFPLKTSVGGYGNWNTVIHSGILSAYLPDWVEKATLSDAINTLEVGDSNPNLRDYYIAQYADGNTVGNNNYYRRPLSALYNTFVNSLDERYLSLSGGEMKGVITMPVNYQIQWGDTSRMIYGDTSTIKMFAPSGVYIDGWLAVTYGNIGRALASYNADAVYDYKYISIAGGSGLPTEAQYGSLLTLPYRSLTNNAKPDYAAQIFIPNGDSATPYMWFRTSLSNSYNPWRKIVSEETDGKVWHNNVVEITRPDSTYDAMFFAKRSDYNWRIGFGIGTSLNRGIYDTDKGWILRIYNGVYSLLAHTVEGDLTVTGGGAFGSDIRYKDIISYRQLDLETIVNAPLFSFRWTDREDKVEHLGTSAQYWLGTQFKDAVNTANKDFYHLDYGALAVGIGISVAREVKVVKTEVELLRDEVRQLKEKLNKYEQVWHN